jgi:small subunit ribosomal protein S1
MTEPNESAPSEQPFPEYKPRPKVSPTDPETTRRARQTALDAEIERELEMALADIGSQSLMPEQPKAKAGAAASPTPPGVKRGRVVAVHGPDVFIDAGGRSQGVLPLLQFPEGKPAVGSEVDVVIEGYDAANGLLNLSRPLAAVAHVDWSSVAEDMIVEARVTGANKGGLEVDVNNIRGFIPISQLDLYRVEDTTPYLNQRLRCLVVEANATERNLVLSRRAVLEKEREQNREKLWAELAEGQVREGIVRSVRDFGAFVDLGGVDGLLHVSEMSWTRVEDPTKVVQPGQKLQVVVTKMDREARKLGLGLKQLLASPWDDIDTRYSTGTIINGKVTRVADFGAFVELEPGIEGLVHISELSHQRVSRVSSVVRVGQVVEVQVLKVDKEAKRVSLSLKGPAPAPVAAAAEEKAEPEAPPRKLPPLKKPLKGGL